MVAAAIFSRHGPASRSAARRNTAARSSNGIAAQASLAVIAASTAAVASACSALVSVPSTALWLCGWTTSMRCPPPMACLPPMTCGRSIGSADEGLESLGEAGAFRGMRCVFVNWLVGRQGYVGDGVHADKDR